MASLRDVADRAKVSLATASRVLSGSDYPVAPELKAAVLSAAAALDYVPNAQAQTLIAGTNQAVGVLVGDVGDPYFSEILHGIHRVATPLNMLVTICSTARDVDRELAYFRMLQSHRYGLVILGGSGLDEPSYQAALAARIAAFESMGGRTISIGNADVGGRRVLVDNRAGAAALAEYLVELGHTAIGIAAGQANLTSTIHRIEGIRTVVEAAGGHVHVAHALPDREGGRRAARQLLDQEPALTAIVGTADQLAIGALHWLQDQGIAVPDDVSVAGFNDIPAALDV
ncbi:MAG: LacI family DNA-binding transcriptional regulator, partial [Propionibacteriaceae bacterium]|nr:LacI family DNA-binding transcriptional regulator [Propionibacteriaceae bacterium]